MVRLTGPWATLCARCKTQIEHTFNGQTTVTIDPLCEGCRNVWAPVPVDRNASSEAAGQDR